jgi:hypothetical protein
MITVDRDKAKEYIKGMYKGEVEVTDKQVDLFVEYVEMYGLSEQMGWDYMDDRNAPKQE